MKDDRKDLPPVSAPNFLEKVREMLQTSLGKRGDVLDRSVTLRDLSQSGLAILRAGLTSGSGSRDPIAGPGAALVASEQASLQQPPTPQGLNVVAGVGYFTVASNVPTYTQGSGHATTLVFGALRASGDPAPVFADARPIGAYAGQTIKIPADPLSVWHVWARWQSVDGAVSKVPAGGANGLVVSVGQDAGVNSFNGRQGAVEPEQADYDSFFTTPAEASAAAPVQSVNGQTGNVTVSVPVLPLASKINNLFASTPNSSTVQTVVTMTVPANYLVPGKVFNFQLEGTQSQSAAASNVVVGVFINGTQLASAAVAGGAAAQTNRSVRAEGSVLYNGTAFYGNMTVGISGVQAVGAGNVAGVPASATAAATIDLRIQTSTANAANIIRATSAFILEIGA